MRIKVMIASCLAITSLGLSSCSSSSSSAPCANYGTNMVTNWSFRTSLTSTGLVDNSTFPPWQIAYGSPRFGAGVGADTIHGYAYLWGTLDDGNAIWQPLTTSIKKNHTYRIGFYAKSSSVNQDFHSQKYINIRFLAFNNNPGGMHWIPDPGNVAVIGETTTTQMDTWANYFLGDWTADADYSNIEIDVSTDVSGSGNESWAGIDLVQLQEKQ